MTTTVQVAAGWYADPVTVTATGATTQRRWWDGTAWTHHTAPIEPVAPIATRPAVSTTTASSAPATLSPSDSARVAENMPLHSVQTAGSRRDRIAHDVAAAAPHSTLSPSTTASPASAASADHGHYEPFSHRRHTEMLERASHRSARNETGLRVHTVSIWLMATMPITQAMLVFWVFSSLPPESSAWTRALTVALPFVLYAALAGQDTRLMEASGHLRTAPWVFALLTPPIYLAVRGVRVARTTGSAPWPLYTWFVVQAGVIGVWWLVDPAAVLGLLGFA